MSSTESIFFWICMLVYALSCSAYMYAFVFRNEKVFERIPLFLLLGLVLHTATIGARYSATGHLPWSGDYEQALMGGWFIILFTLIVAFRRKDLHFLAIGTVPATMLMMGFGVMRKPALLPKMASLKTFWLYIHVYFAWLAYGAYILAMAAGILYLLKRRDASRGQNNPIYEQRVPSLERLDDLMFRYIIFGFITNAIEIAAGSIWAKDLWGSYWSWDPVETWALVGWLEYGIFIHLRVSLGWRGVKMAWLAIFAVVAIFISFFGVNFAVDTSLHMFSVR